MEIHDDSDGSHQDNFQRNDNDDKFDAQTSPDMRVRSLE
jgi:hypothetical protein